LSIAGAGAEGRIVVGMPEPVSGIAGAVKATQAGVEVAKAAFQVGRGASRLLAPRDTVERLLSLAGAKLSQTTGLGYPELLDWREDPAVARALDRLTSPPYEPDLVALRAAILPHVGQPDETTSEEEFAGQIAGLLVALLPLAQQGDELVRHAFYAQQLTSGGAVRLLDVEWAPQRARQELRALARLHPREAAALEDALAGREVRVTLPVLVQTPQPWLADGSGALWVTVARFAETSGLWEQARDAWARANLLPDTDRVRAILREGRAAEVLGDQDAFSRALELASEIDPRHPLVAVEQARQAGTPDDGLVRLDHGRAPQDGEERAAVEAERALLLASLERFDEADVAAKNARQTAPEFLPGKEAVAGAVLLRARHEWLAARPPALAVSHAAAELYLELSEDLRGSRAFGDSATMRIRAAELLAYCGDRERARELLNPVSFTAEERAEQDIACDAGGIAMLVADSEAALGWLTAERATSTQAQVLRALALVRTGREHLPEAVALFDTHVREQGDYQAAMARLITVAVAPEVGWSESAAAVVHDGGSPETVALLRSRYLLATGDWQAAHESLLGYAGDIRIQGALVELFAGAPNSAAAVTAARALLALDPSWELRLSSAETLWDNGEPAEAEQALRAVATSEAAPVAARVEACRALADRLAGAARYQDTLELVDEWLHLQADNKQASWFRAYLLGRLARFEEANAALATADLSPTRVQEARVRGEITLHTGDIARAIEGLARFADDLPAVDDELERDIARTADYARGVLPEALIAALAARPRRGSAPRGLSGGVVDLGAAAARIGRQEELVRGIAAGRTPVGSLASAAGQTLAETFARLLRLPLIDPRRDAEEIQEAEAALGAGAILDTGTMNTLGALPEQLATLLLSRLPNSAVTQGVIDDLVQAHLQARLRAPRPGEEALLPRLARMVAIVGSLRVEPDTHPGRPSTADPQLLRPLDGPSRAVVSSLGLAERTGLPIWCDDRVVRTNARESGQNGFSTADLLLALERRGTLSEADKNCADGALASYGVAVEWRVA
jgi:tetratricopeptide (TPR) repeat protein